MKKIKKRYAIKIERGDSIDEEGVKRKELFAQSHSKSDIFGRNNKNRSKYHANGKLISEDKPS